MGLKEAMVGSGAAAAGIVIGGGFYVGFIT
jgi:hypothetical protein